MRIATITTGIHIGPFKIPANGQNMIMNNYAFRNQIIVDFTIPEPIMSDSLQTVQWMHHKKKFSKLILCSIHQLPSNKIAIKKLINNLSKVEFHFALEGIKGKGKKFLSDCIKEKNIFQKANKIKPKKISWVKLSNLIKKK